MQKWLCVFKIQGIHCRMGTSLFKTHLHLLIQSTSGSMPSVPSLVHLNLLHLYLWNIFSLCLQAVPPILDCFLKLCKICFTYFFLLKNCLLRYNIYSINSTYLKLYVNSLILKISHSFFFNLFIWRLITLQYYIGFAIY